MGEKDFMQKTRLGITAGAVGAAAYLAGFFGGYIVVILITGYVLLFEENAWLRRCVVKAVVLMLFFTFLTSTINLLPDILEVISDFVAIWGGSFKYSTLNSIISCINTTLSVIEKALILGLGIKSTRQETIIIPLLDSLVSRYMS